MTTGAHSAAFHGICLSRRAGVATCARFRRRGGALVVLLAIVAGGCQVSGPRPSTETPPEPAQPQATADLSTAIGHLERGDEKRARTVLLRLREKTPESPVVEHLLRQIDTPAEEVLPGPYRQIAVSTGESLSLIAGRELGDPLLFYALARLNDIKAPADISAGTRIRIPASDPVQPGKPAEVSGSGGVSAAQIVSVADHFAQNGQREQARRRLTAWLADNDQETESAQRRLVEITLQEIADAGPDVRLERSVAIIDEALSVVDAPAARAQLIETKSTLQSQALYRLALRLEEQGDLEAAYARAAEAAALDSAPKSQALASRLETEVVDLLHENALVAWRNRDVDVAIRNWESLLEIAPDFEPAQVYIERARRLRRRLEQP